MEPIDSLTVDRREIKQLSTLIADRLADLIQSGGLAPGARLVQTDLARRFGVSRVAVRDALQELRQRGLAVPAPAKGLMVRPISYRMIRDLFTARQIVEGSAARLACTIMDPALPDQLDQLIGEQETLSRQADMAQLVDADWVFHRTLYGQCGNELLVEIIEGLWARMRQMRSLARANLAWGRQWSSSSIARHRRIVDALRRRDGEAAGRLVTETIQLARDELLQGLQESGWSEENGPDTTTMGVNGT